MSGRTAKSIKNIKYAVIGQGFALLISFVTRMVFVRTLSIEYLGIDGLFSNILLLLSLADLGIGVAMIYSLYKPLADNDEHQIMALMNLYKRAFLIIGLIVIGAGIILTPFIDFFIKEMPDIPYLKLIFMMFVVNTAITYFFAFKRSIIIADQKRYVTSLYRYSFYFGLNVVQIIILLLTHNYILYVSLLLLNTLLENYFVARKAEKLFPFIKKPSNAKLDKQEYREIIKNVKAMSFHKIGGVLVNGTDNLLLSKIIGVVTVGIYSNYLLITNALTMVFSLMFQAITASIGNLAASSEDRQKALHIFNVLNYSGFWIYGLSSIILLVVFNPFISVWLGDDYLFAKHLVLLVVINFYLTGMRKSVLTYRDALGLYWYDRHKPIFELIIKVGVSIFLGLKYGIAGVFLGTTVSTITTCFWIEPYILYKYGFRAKMKTYFIRYIYYTIIVIGAGALTLTLSNLLPFRGILLFLANLVISLILPNIIFFIFTYKLREFIYLKDTMLAQFRLK